MPVQKTRRSPAPWRSYYKKSSYGGNDFRQAHYNNRYYNKKPIRPPYPSASDDFNQGYETENNVHIPHGKDISHSISFGKPYIPYNVKGSSSPLGHER